MTIQNPHQNGVLETAYGVNDCWLDECQKELSQSSFRYTSLQEQVRLALAKIKSCLFKAVIDDKYYDVFTIKAEPCFKISEVACKDVDSMAHQLALVLRECFCDINLLNQSIENQPLNARNSALQSQYIKLIINKADSRCAAFEGVLKHQGALLLHCLQDADIRFDGAYDAKTLSQAINLAVTDDYLHQAVKACIDNEIAALNQHIRDLANIFNLQEQDR